VKKFLLFLFLILIGITGVFGEKAPGNSAIDFMQTPFGEMIIRSGKEIFKRSIVLKSCINSKKQVYVPFRISNQQIIGLEDIEHKRDRSIYISRKSPDEYQNKIGEYRIDYLISVYTDEKLELDNDTSLYGSEKIFSEFSAIEKIEVRIWIFQNNIMVNEAPFRQVIPIPLTLDNIQKNETMKAHLPPFEFKFHIDNFKRGLDNMNRYSFESINMDIEVLNTATFAGEPIKTES
jgi:hypothetical protein